MALPIATAGIVLMRQVQPVLRRNLIENNTHGGLVVNGRALTR
ncbi:hypothetical protein [Moorena sp. SIO3H5]|nr:hypothetical protein [Moorena sp. SIO3H5]